MHFSLINQIATISLRKKHDKYVFIRKDNNMNNTGYMTTY